MNKLTVITSFCGRPGEEINNWFAATSRLTRKVSCVCHKLFGADSLVPTVKACAAAHRVDVSIDEWPAAAMAERGFSACWNSCIDRVDTDWFVTIAGDEFIEEPQHLLSVCNGNCDIISLRFVCPVQPELTEVYRGFRKSSGFRYFGLVHEEAYDGYGRHHQSHGNLARCNSILRHRRVPGERRIQFVLVLRGLFDRGARKGTNSWWYDDYCLENAQEVVEGAIQYAATVGFDLFEVLRVPMDWDWWRENYDKWPFHIHQLFYEAVYRNYPTQRFVCLPALEQFFSKLPGDHKVVEIGGWDGNAAVEQLSKFPNIQQWDNYDICQSAVLNGRKVEWFNNHSLDGWPWDVALPESDIFVAAHTLEHMKAGEIDRLLARNPWWQHAFVECPIPQLETPNWNGYGGTHILEIPWQGLVALFAKHGFKLVTDNGDIKTFSK